MANITVTVYDSTENKRVPVELPERACSGQSHYCRAGGQAAITAKTVPMASAAQLYKFHHKNSGRQIQDSQTLADAAVKEGDILRLQPEITAGAR